MIVIKYYLLSILLIRKLSICYSYWKINSIFPKKLHFKSKSNLHVNKLSINEEQQIKSDAIDILDCLTSSKDQDDVNYDSEKDLRWI